MNVLVTGASGFVGRRLCTQLMADGNRVVAPVRHSASRAPMPGGVQVFEVGDPLSSDALAPLMAGVDAVVHLAARVHVMKETTFDPLVEFRRVNVDGTGAVMRAARGAGVRHFVYLSSIKVNGERRETPYAESDTPRPVDAYGLSKRDAEDVVRAAEGTPTWTIVRPPLVYGPGVGGNFRRLLRLARAAGRWPLPLGGIDNLRSMIFVDNLTSAISLTLVHPLARQRTFLVSDDRDIGVSDLLRRLAFGMGCRPRLFRAPAGLLRQAATVLGREADFERVFGTLRIDCTLIRSVLDWRPPVELGDALGVTARWWRDTAEG